MLCYFNMRFLIVECSDLKKIFDCLYVIDPLDILKIPLFMFYFLLVPLIILIYNPSFYCILNFIDDIKLCQVKFSAKPSTADVKKFEHFLEAPLVSLMYLRRFFIFLLIPAFSSRIMTCFLFVAYF